MDRRFSKREQEIIDIVYKLKQVSVQDVIDNLEKPPSYSAVRALLRIMEEKEILKHREKGSKYIYELQISRNHIRKGAVRKLVELYFDNSIEDAVSALIQERDTKLSTNEIQAIENLINDTRKRQKESDDVFEPD